MNNTDIRSSFKDLPWFLWIAGIAVLIYGYSVVTNAFFSDDINYLFEPSGMTSWKNLWKVYTFKSYFSPFPLTMTVFWLQRHLWGAHPLGYHAVNVIFHILNAMLLFRLGRRLQPALAPAIALLFVVHPIQVETVAWIAELKNLLCLFFFLLAFHAFLDLDAKNRKQDSLRMFLFFVAALLGKCVAICFAVVPVLYAWWKYGKVTKQAWLTFLFFSLIGSVSVFAPVHFESLEPQPMGLLFPEKIILAGKNFFFYIKQVLLPSQFLIFYPKANVQAFRWENWLYPASVAALYLFLFLARRRIGRGAFALLLFYGISIFPALGFFRLANFYFTDASDHFSYLSVPSLLFLICGTGHVLLSRAGIRSPSLFLKKSIAFLVLLYLSLMSFRLTLNYKDLLSPFYDLLRQTPGSFAGYHIFGAVCADKIIPCNADDTFYLLKSSVQINPDDYIGRSHLGFFYAKNGMYEEAGAALAQSCLFMKGGGGAECFYNWGAIEAHLGNRPKAVEAFRRSIELYPKFTQSYAGLGECLMESGDLKNACQVLEEGRRVAPQDKTLERLSGPCARQRSVP